MDHEDGLSINKPRGRELDGQRCVMGLTVVAPRTPRAPRAAGGVACRLSCPRPEREGAAEPFPGAASLAGRRRRGSQGTRRWGALVLLILVAWLGLLGVAQARVVGMVVDDSGSMKTSFHKALFAAQLLIASLGPEDQLFIARLNGGGGQVEAVPPETRGDVLRQMQRNWQGKGQHTPFEPLERMLEHLAEVTAAGEDADLLVFADGAFEDPPADARAVFEAIKSRFSGTRLQVYFVWLPGNAMDRGLRDALLSVFNGAPTAGARDISQPSEVFSGLAEVVEAMAGADSVESESLVSREGESLTYTLPFAVRRVIAVTTGDAEREPARWRRASFELTQDPPTTLEPRMGRKDEGDATQLRARVVRLESAAPLPAGSEIRLEFDRPLAPEDRILFDADLDIAVEVRGRDGVAVPRDASGRLRVAQGEPLTVHARFMDRDAAGWKPLNLAGTGLVPELTLGDGVREQAMTVDPASGVGRAPAGPYDAPGQRTLSVTGRIRGLKYLRADDLVIDVVPLAQVSPKLTTERLLPCAGCAPDEARLPLIPGPAGAEALALVASVSAVEGPADFALTLDAPLPPGLTLSAADGTPALDAEGRGRLRLAPGESARLVLTYGDDWAPEGPESLGFTLNALDPLQRGATRLELRLLPVAAPLELALDGHTGADQSQPFSVPVTELGEGQGAYVAARGLRAPLSVEHLTLEPGDAGPLALRLQDGRILLSPESGSWLPCLAESGERPFVLRYHNPRTLQSAELRASLEVAPVPWWRRCWREALALLLLLAVLAKLYCLSRSERFPPRSRALRMDEDASVSAGAQRERLRLSAARAFLLCGPERRRVYGFTLLPRYNGAVILRPEGEPPPLFHAGIGESLASAFSEAHVREVPWGWGEELVDEEGGWRYLLVEDISRTVEE